MAEDSEKKRRDPNDTPRGPLGDARPDAAEGQAHDKVAEPPEKVEDRPLVSKVKPEDYPSQQ